MASQHAGGSGEFIHVGGAGGGAVETLLDAVAFFWTAGKEMLISVRTPVTSKPLMSVEVGS